MPHASSTTVTIVKASGILKLERHLMAYNKVTADELMTLDCIKLPGKIFGDIKCDDNTAGFLHGDRFWSVNARACAGRCKIENND